MLYLLKLKRLIIITKVMDEKSEHHGVDPVSID